MALARSGWAVLLAEGTLQEQLREREGRQAVATGIKREIQLTICVNFVEYNCVHEFITEFCH